MDSLRCDEPRRTTSHLAEHWALSMGPMSPLIYGIKGGQLNPLASTCRRQMAQSTKFQVQRPGIEDHRRKTEDERPGTTTTGPL